jgi:monovalent cation:H+ antiporter-2, CPA2 family
MMAGVYLNRETALERTIPRPSAARRIGDGRGHFPALQPAAGARLSAVGSIIGPHALNLMSDIHSAEYLAEFGVVFLMFSIGLEFSLPKLYAMKRIVFGLGLLQVVLTMLLVAILVMVLGIGWQLGIALGGVLAMSSTAVLTKLLTERMQLNTAHGREIMGVLLFQDLAVVPLLVIIPSLTQPPEELAMLLGIALLKAVVVLAVILVFGQKLMRKWFHFVARAKSSEVFVLNVLLITLGLATLTQMAGLSLALGAFVAGMLISETEYRLQVEEDIKPFRDVLMGLFFVTIGVKLDLHILIGLWWQVLLLLRLAAVEQGAIVGLLSWRLGASPGNAIRSALWLCAGGEFGFVLLGEIAHMPKEVEQVVLTSLVLSMLIAPFIVQYSEKLVMRFVASEWLTRSMHLTQIAAQSMSTEKHAILCGFGRNGQYLARFLGQEGNQLHRPRSRSRPCPRSGGRRRKRRLRRCRAQGGADGGRPDAGQRRHRHHERHAAGREGPASRPGAAARFAGDRSYRRRA